MTYPDFFKELCYDVFLASFTTYLISLAIESVSRGFVTSVVQLNVVLIIAALSGLGVVLFPPKIANSQNKIDTVLITILAILVGIQTYQWLKGDRTLAIILASSMTLVILFFSHSMKKISHNDF